MDPSLDLMCIYLYVSIWYFMKFFVGSSWCSYYFWLILKALMIFQIIVPKSSDLIENYMEWLCMLITNYIYLDLFRACYISVCDLGGRNFGIHIVDIMHNSSCCFSINNFWFYTSEFIAKYLDF